MSILNISFLSISILLIIVLLLLLIHTDPINKIKRIGLLKKKSKTQLELYQDFFLEVLLDSGINLENVLIKPSYLDKNGSCLIINSKLDYKTKIKKQLFTNQINTNQIYLILPEIVDLTTLWVCVHEIGHYVLNHLTDDRPDYIHEYEAENYANTIIKLCPLETGVYEYENIYFKNIHNIYITTNINRAKRYVKSYYDTYMNNLTYSKTIELSKYKSLNKDIKNYINTEEKYK